jgi:hypothetical protein
MSTRFRFLPTLVVGWLFLAAVLGAGPGEAAPDAPGDSRVVTYYFHTTGRCTTCVKIEEMAKEVVEQGFAAQVRSGRLSFRSVDVQFPENRHLVRQYQLVTKSVVLVEEKDGKPLRWKNLDQVWQLVWSKDRYQNYVRGELNRFLGGR